MTTTRDVTVWCDDCGGWRLVGTEDPDDARAQLLERGWEFGDDLDLCSSCAAERDPDFQDTFTTDDLNERNPEVMEAAKRHAVRIVDPDTGESRMTMGTMSVLEDPWLHPRGWE